MNIKSLCLYISGIVLSVPFVAAAQEWQPLYSIYGTPGLIETPSALSRPDAEFAMTFSNAQTNQSVVANFQITPRMSGGVRITQRESLDGSDLPVRRGFDWNYRFVDESAYVPAFSLGATDISNHSGLSAEYIVATKTLGRFFRVSAGLGWGRLAGENSFDNPFGVVFEGMNERPDRTQTASSPKFAGLFEGDAAFFGGVEARLTRRVSVTAEYSSDSHALDVAEGRIDHKSPFNFGISYTPTDNYQVNVYSLYGSEFGFGLSAILDPYTKPNGSGFDNAPIPIGYAALKAETPAAPRPGTRLAKAMKSDGLTLLGMNISGDTATLRYANNRYNSTAQGLGRASRIAAATLPDSVKNFVLEPAEKGLPLFSTLIARAELQRHENTVGAVQAIAQSSVTDAPMHANLEMVNAEPSFDWGISPYSDVTLFDRDQDLMIEVGAELSMSFSLSPRTEIDFALRQNIWDNSKAEKTRTHPELTNVREGYARFSDSNSPKIEELSVSHFTKLSPTVYGRVTAGYPERMHAAVSGEVLWKPVQQPVALGAELNYSSLRDTDQLFGLADHEIVTGHVSGYVDFGDGYHGRIHAGRFLAGDYGISTGIERRMNNGWIVSGELTYTQHPDTDREYASGNMIVSIPLDWVSGKPSKRDINLKLGSLQTDAGARLKTKDRLYDTIGDAHSVKNKSGWGRFWK